MAGTEKEEIKKIKSCRLFSYLSTQLVFLQQVPCSSDMVGDESEYSGPSI